MPRKRQTMSGAPGQSPAPVPGQTYGMGVEQQRLAEAMPSPNSRPPTPDASPASMAVPPPAPGVSAGGPAPSPDAVRAEQFQAALAAAQQLKGRAGMLTQPTTRPNEPVTAGVSIGAGPGPEALGMPRGNPTGTTLRKLAAATGDSYLRELAERAGL